MLRLGITTDTQDMEGTILKESPVQVSEEEVRTCILSFQGEQQQVPPMYSALKVNGKKLYELAREGKVVERKARPVTFHNIEVLWMEPPKAKIRCSVPRERISGSSVTISVKNWDVAVVWKNFCVPGRAVWINRRGKTGRSTKSYGRR